MPSSPSSAETNPQESRPVRRLLTLAIRLFVAGALLTWLVRSGRIDVAALRELEPGRGEIGLALLAVLAVGAGFMVLALRLQLLLRLVDLQVGFGRTLRVIVLGLFSSTFLPGSVGGDVVRAAMLFQGLESGRRRVIGSLAVDRLLGLLALFVLASLAAGIGAAVGALDGIPRTLLLIPVLIVIGVPVGLYMVVALGPWFARRLPEVWIDRIEPLTICLSGLARRPKLALGTLVLGMINHALVVVTFVAADRMLGGAGSLAQHLLFDPLAMSLNAVPISPGGLGVAESLFSYLYAIAGNPDGATVGVIGRLIQYVAYALGGGVALLVAGGSPARATSETDTDGL
jgi:uncharacterized membrane protein YbhN (UPF0104 family)